jgi:hypothetical protein
MFLVVGSETTTTFNHNLSTFDTLSESKVGFKKNLQTQNQIK